MRPHESRPKRQHCAPLSRTPAPGGRKRKLWQQLNDSDISSLRAFQSTTEIIWVKQLFSSSSRNRGSLRLVGPIIAAFPISHPITTLPTPKPFLFSQMPGQICRFPTTKAGICCMSQQNGGGRRNHGLSRGSNNRT